MVRLRVYEEPMTPTERRRKSDAERAERGEYRLNQWIGPEAKAALDALVGPEPERGAITEVVSQALIELAARIKKKGDK